MEGILSSFNFQIDEIDKLKEKIKSKKKLAIIDNYANLFNEVKNNFVEHYKKDKDNVPIGFIESQLTNMKKFTQLLLRGELKGLMSRETIKELIESTNEIERLNEIIKQKNKEIELTKEKCVELENMVIKDENTKKELEILKNKYNEEITKSQNMFKQSEWQITPSFNMSVDKEEDFIAFIEKYEKDLDKCKKVRETSSAITYEVDKKFIDCFKDDKRSSPKINKKDKILLTTPKNVNTHKYVID